MSAKKRASLKQLPKHQKAPPDTKLVQAELVQAKKSHAVVRIRPDRSPSLKTHNREKNTSDFLDGDG